MPRRKPQSAVRNKDRPRLQLPQGDEGTELTPEQRKEKLQLFLEDFDAEVKLRESELRGKLKSLLTSLASTSRCAMMKYPKSILKMPLDEFLATGGVINDDKLREQEDLVSSMLPSSSLAAGRARLAAVSAMECISEDSDQPATTKTKRTQAGRKVLSTVQNTGIRRSKRNTAQSSIAAADPTLLETPLQNPAGHSVLASMKTANTAIKRIPKPGEMVYSVAGSPLSVPNLTNRRESQVVKMTLGNDKILTVPKNRALAPEEARVGDLDEDTRDKLELLQENIALLLSHPKMEQQKK